MNRREQYLSFPAADITTIKNTGSPVMSGPIFFILYLPYLFYRGLGQSGFRFGDIRFEDTR